MDVSPRLSAAPLDGSYFASEDYATPSWEENRPLPFNPAPSCPTKEALSIHLLVRLLCVAGALRFNSVDKMRVSCVISCLLTAALVASEMNDKTKSTVTEYFPPLSAQVPIAPVPA